MNIPHMKSETLFHLLKQITLFKTQNPKTPGTFQINTLLKSEGRAQSVVVKKSTTAAAFREEIRKRIILTVDEEVSRKSTDPTIQLEREKMRRDSRKMRQRMRQRLYRYETDLAVFGQAFKEATWAERLGVVNNCPKKKWRRYKKRWRR